QVDRQPLVQLPIVLQVERIFIAAESLRRHRSPEGFIRHAEQEIGQAVARRDRPQASRRYAREVEPPSRPLLQIGTELQMHQLRAAAESVAPQSVAQVIAVLDILVLAEALIADVAKRVYQAAAVNSDFRDACESRVSCDALELGADALSDGALVLMNLAAFQPIHSEQERADQLWGEAPRPPEREIT